ncbi:hypothetical protein EJP77_00645 [Paenibacillus zeisoli]|uniref:Uncharacterized protein n=1 Tax=Paenibacillus zeisoli TaxID=2496267 RepID=A0A433XN82_9BACL|nr:hypothetical protein [Paenibacillus zeisoli]RUT35565.1 hypothetical protein EJP77_00645 [Paenibacillus zeisoli]
MNTIVSVLISLLIVLFVFSLIRKVSSTRKIHRLNPLARSFRKAPDAPSLAEPESPAYDLAVKLEKSISAEWANSLKQRVLAEHPYISEREYEWRWVELKRFFVMCSVLKQVPMFSRAVDEVWHEMLMYTQEYHQFSNRFLGQMLHHAPNGEPSIPMPNERAWFDLVYVELFGWNYHNAVIWGAFFRNPLPKEELERYSQPGSVLEPQSRFNTWAYEKSPEARKAIDKIIDNLQLRIELAEQQLTPDRKMDFRDTDLLLTSAVFFSFNDPDNFVDHMVPEQLANRKDTSGCTSASACGSGGADSSNPSCSSSHCSGSHSSGSHCSSSSCSSGSSCGSGCGGGGGD